MLGYGGVNKLYCGNHFCIVYMYEIIALYILNYTLLYFSKAGPKK